MSVLHVRETPRRYTEAEAKEVMQTLLSEQSARNPLCEFVLSDNCLTLYWRCEDGFDYGLYSYMLDGCIGVVWDGETTMVWRKWRPDADSSTQISADPGLPPVPAQPDAFGEGAGPT
jgi:hypothetical protein